MLFVLFAKLTTGRSYVVTFCPAFHLNVIELCVSFTELVSRQGSLFAGKDKTATVGCGGSFPPLSFEQAVRVIKIMVSNTIVFFICYCLIINSEQRLVDSISFKIYLPGFK